MKKILLLIMCLVGLLTCASCGSEKKSGVIKVWWPGGSDAELAIMKEAKKQYEELNPGVTIDIIAQSTTNFYMNYSLSLLGNDYPDVCYVDHVYVQTLAHDGAIANLSGLGMNDTKATFIDSLWAPNTYEGDLYALPISANTLVTCYNKTLLSEVMGKEYTDSDLPKDYEEFKAQAQMILDYNKAHNLKGDEAYIPLTIPAGSSNESMAAMAFLEYAAKEGGKIMSDDLRTMTLDTDACLNAATKIQEMGKLGYTTNVFSEARFEGGKIAFMEMGSWKFQDYDRIEQQRNLKFGYAPSMRFTKDGSNASALGLFSMVVTNKSPNRKIAADFIKFVATNDELQLLNNTVQNVMPTTKTAIKDEFYQSERWQVYTEQLKNVVARPGSPEWPTIELQLANFVTALISGSREPNYLTDLNFVLQAALDEIYE